MKDEVLSFLKKDFDKTLNFLNKEFVEINVGRASVSVLDSVLVDNFGADVPIKNIASVSIEDARTILISPWNNKDCPKIEKAILQKGMDFSVQSDGKVVRVKLPILTEEKRKEIIKKVHRVAEDARISIRNERHNAIKKLRKAESDKEISEDDMKAGEKEIQNETDSINEKIEDKMKKKESSIKII